jgi:hypothetical protein
MKSFSEVSVIVCLVQAVIDISSANAEHCFKGVDMLSLSSSCFEISSIILVKRVSQIFSQAQLICF